MRELVGSLLIAPPSVRGNFWQKSVVLLTEHHRQGSVGLYLNKVSKMTIKEFAKQNNVMLDISGFLHIGGPVNVQALTLLHTNEWSCGNTMRINEEFSISSSPEILTNMAMGFVPKKWRMFVGLCGWAPTQLENEIKGNPPFHPKNSWVIASATEKLVFDLEGQTQWTESIEQAGSEFAQKFFA